MSSPAAAPWRGRILALILGSAALAVVLAVMSSPIFDLDRHAVPKELVLHVTAWLGLVILVPRWRWLEAGMVEWLLGLYVAWSAVSALLAANHWIAFRAWGVSFAGLVVYEMARAARRHGQGSPLVAALGFAVTVAALTGLAQAYGLDGGLLAGERAPGGTLGNRNFLAHLAVIGLPVVGSLAATARGRAGMIGGAAAIVVLATAIVLTRSRAAWLAGAMTGTVVLLAAWWRGRAGARPGGTDGAARRSVRRPRLLIPGAIGAGLLAALLLPNRLSWRSESPYRDSLTGLINYQEGSGRGRLIQYANSLRLVPRDPVFGTGPGNWMVAYPLVTTPGDPSYAGADPVPTNPWPSSDWIAVLAERGPIGALLLLLAGLSAALVALRRLRDPETGVHAVAALGVLTATVTTGLFDAVMLLAPPTLLVFAALGALLPDTGAVVTRPLEGRRRMAAILVPLAVATALVAQSAGQLNAIRITQVGRQRDAAREALRYDPGNYRLHLLLAMRGSCDHARAARRLLPNHEWPRRLMRNCR